MNVGAIVVGDHVQAALDSGRPVVALESTIFTHGLPRPRNLEVALEAEGRLAALGVTAATIGVHGGRVVVGLTSGEIEALANDHDAMKLSVRDLSVAAATRASGGTTVAATAFLAHKVGIPVFATGGLGGVHRDAATTFDESADLPILAQTPILMVAAGVKSILDVAASLERLETLSIAVVGYQSTAFPGFYVADSGFSVDHVVTTPLEAAELMRSHVELGVPGAVLVANPVKPEAQLDPTRHQEVLSAAFAAAAGDGVVGHDTTPYLLDYIQRATEGESLEVNVKVYEGNVSLAGNIAAALARTEPAHA